jgi:hypothetical protein
LLAQSDEAFANADAALRCLKGKTTLRSDELETVGEWRQWKESIKQLEQSKWA